MKTILLLAAAVLALDQATKFAALRAFAGGDAAPVDPMVVVPGFFDLRLALNDGAAWGGLAGRQWLLVLVSVAMLAILWWNRRDLAASRLSRIAGGLLAGGIAGNLVDRALRGRVVDFLDLHWREAYHYPTFNVADIAICSGVGLLLLHTVLCSRRKR